MNRELDVKKEIDTLFYKNGVAIPGSGDVEMKVFSLDLFEYCIRKMMALGYEYGKADVLKSLQEHIG